jgi:hypothetical protein
MTRNLHDFTEGAELEKAAGELLATPGQWPAYMKAEAAA